jgi:hypothetical protein
MTKALDRSGAFAFLSASFRGARVAGEPGIFFSIDEIPDRRGAPVGMTTGRDHPERVVRNDDARRSARPTINTDSDPA